MKELKKERRPFSFAEIHKNKPFLLGDASNRITFGVNAAGKSERVQILIGEFLMSEVGLAIGDKIDIVFYPEDRMACLKRVEEDGCGFTICRAYKDTGRGRVSFVWKSPIPYHKGSVVMESVEVKKEPDTCKRSIYFNFPKVCTFYDEEGPKKEREHPFPIGM